MSRGAARRDRPDALAGGGARPAAAGDRRSGGPDDRRRAALARLRRRGRRARRQAAAAHLRRARPRRRPRRPWPRCAAGCSPTRSWRPPTGSCAPTRQAAIGVACVSRAPRVAVVVFPGTWSDRDFAHVAGLLGWEARLVWHTERRPRRRRCGRAARRLRPRRPPADRRDRPLLAGDARGRGVRRSRRPGPRLVQRLPDPDRGGHPARRPAAQRPPRVPLRLAAAAGRAGRRALARRAEPRARRSGCRSRTARAATTPTPRSSTSWRPTGRVVLRYADEDGAVTPDANPNGSLRSIAGIVNERGNVLGLMPHPGARGGGRGRRHRRPAHPPRARRVAGRAAGRRGASAMMRGLRSGPDGGPSPDAG